MEMDLSLILQIVIMILVLLVLYKQHFSEEETTGNTAMSIPETAMATENNFRGQTMLTDIDSFMPTHGQYIPYSFDEEVTPIDTLL